MYLAGESNVYTLGNIGAHRVVSTKLPSVGHTREAMIAAGNTTTRLLGTFNLSCLRERSIFDSAALLPLSPVLRKSHWVVKEKCIRGRALI